MPACRDEAVAVVGMAAAWLKDDRKTGNPTVDVLDRLAKTLGVGIGEVFKEPRKGSEAPKPLRGGRRSSP